MKERKHVLKILKETKKALKEEDIVKQVESDVERDIQKEKDEMKLQ